MGAYVRVRACVCVCVCVCVCSVRAADVLLRPCPLPTSPPPLLHPAPPYTPTTPHPPQDVDALLGCPLVMFPLELLEDHEVGEWGGGL